MPLDSANGFGYGISSARCAPGKDLKMHFRSRNVHKKIEPAQQSSVLHWAAQVVSVVISAGCPPATDSSSLSESPPLCPSACEGGSTRYTVSGVSSTARTSIPGGSWVPSSCSTAVFGSASNCRLKASSSKLLWTILCCIAPRSPPPIASVIALPFPLPLRPTRPTTCSHPERRQSQYCSVRSPGQETRRRPGESFALPRHAFRPPTLDGRRFEDDGGTTRGHRSGGRRATAWWRLVRSLWRLPLLPWRPCGPILR